MTCQTWIIQQLPEKVEPWLVKIQVVQGRYIVVLVLDCIWLTEAASIKLIGLVAAHHDRQRIMGDCTHLPYKAERSAKCNEREKERHVRAHEGTWSKVVLLHTSNMIKAASAFCRAAQLLR